MDAYSLFYKENKDGLFAYLLRMTGDYHLSCDVVQESFARYLGRYGSRNGNRPLLYTIARNAALDAIRRQRPESLGDSGREDARKNPEQQMMDRQAFDRTLAAGMQAEDMDGIMAQLQVQTRQQTRNQAEALSLQTMQTARTMARMGIHSTDVSDTLCQALQNQYTHQFAAGFIYHTTRSVMNLDS